jgi:hypothetical protein
MPREFAKIASSIGKAIKERCEPVERPLPEHLSALLDRLEELEASTTGTKKKPRTRGAGLLRKLGGTH